MTAEPVLLFTPWDTPSLWRSLAIHAPLLRFMAKEGHIKPIPPGVETYWDARPHPRDRKAAIMRDYAHALVEPLTAPERSILVELPAILRLWPTVEGKLTRAKERQWITLLAAIVLEVSTSLSWEDLPGTLEARREILALELRDRTGWDYHTFFIAGHGVAAFWWPAPVESSGGMTDKLAAGEPSPPECPSGTTCDCS